MVGVVWLRDARAGGRPDEYWCMRVRAGALRLRASLGHLLAGCYLPSLADSAVDSASAGRIRMGGIPWRPRGFPRTS